MLNIQKQTSKDSQGSPRKMKPSLSSVPSIAKPSVGSVMKAPQIAHIESKSYQIVIRNHRFEPDNLNVEKGSIVEWRVLTTFGFEDSNLCHVIAFEYAPLAQTKSPLLKLNDAFRVRFLEPGVYHYKC
jgi:plastocyanin